MTLQVIVFSKSRPLQLHGYLSSLYGLAVDPHRLRVKVLARETDHWDEIAYAEVAAEFPQVDWHIETDFAQDLEALIDDDVSSYTMFGCDDVVFTSWLDILALEVRMEVAGAIGVSLRLGRHTTLDMFGNPMRQPQFDETGPWLSWDVEGAAVDWGYPWEVLGTIYTTDFVQRMVARIKPRSPSELEAKGALCWWAETDLRWMTCRESSSLVVPTVNVVQAEYPNGIKGETQLEPEFLLDCWRHGMRLDWRRYRGETPDSWRVPDFYLKRV